MGQHRRTEHPRIDDRLAGAVGAHRVHHVGGIAEQRHAAVDPAGHRVAVDHRVLEDLGGAAQHGGHVEPVVVPALEVMDEIIDRNASVPVALGPALGVVDRDLGDPVDGGQAGGRVGRRDRVEHDPVPQRADADEGRTAADRRALRGAAPEDRAAPLDGRLRGVHLRPHRRVQAVGGHQQAAFDFEPAAIEGVDEGGDAGGVVAVSADLVAQADRIAAEPFERRPVQQHLQLAAVHRVLRPAIARQQAARLGIDVIAVAADQGPLAGLDADGVEQLVVEAEVVQLAHGIGLQVDADAQRLQLGHGLEDDARHADLVQREGERDAADAAAGDQHGAGVHVR